jgi:hypothetical protein
MFKPPALTQELLALHNRDMERRMLSKFKEDRRAGEIRFVKESPKHRLIVPQSGGTGGGDGASGANRSAAVAVANMKRMLSAAMGGPDSPLILKGDPLHSGYGSGSGVVVGGVGGNVGGPAGESHHQLQQAGQQRRYQEQQQQQQHCRELPAAAVHHHHHHHHSQGAVGGEGESGGVGADGAHSPACLLRGSGSSQPPWSAYGSVGGPGGPSGSGSGAGLAAGGAPGASAYSVAMLKGSGGSVLSLGAGTSSSNKHGGHEGHFGYNQSNMMQRGTPSTMTGYSSLPGRYPYLYSVTYASIP